MASGARTLLQHPCRPTIALQPVPKHNFRGPHLIMKQDPSNPIALWAMDSSMASTLTALRLPLMKFIKHRDHSSFRGCWNIGNAGCQDQ